MISLWQAVAHKLQHCIAIVPLLHNLDLWNMHAQVIVYSGCTSYRLMSDTCSSSFHEENAKQKVKRTIPGHSVYNNLNKKNKTPCNAIQPADVNHWVGSNCVHSCLRTHRQGEFQFDKGTSTYKLSQRQYDISKGLIQELLVHCMYARSQKHTQLQLLQ